jgi:hypothetical protein
MFRKEKGWVDQTVLKRLKKQDIYLCFVELKKDSSGRCSRKVSLKLVRVWYQGVNVFNIFINGIVQKVEEGGEWRLK